jgi:hypothetical protein
MDEETKMSDLWSKHEFRSHGRPRTDYRVTDVDESKVYVTASLAIPKEELGLDDEEALSDRAEFGDNGTILTLSTRSRAHMEDVHSLWRLDPGMLLERDPRPVWRSFGNVVSEIGRNMPRFPRPVVTTWEEVSAGKTRKIVLTGPNRDDRVAAAKALATQFGKSLLVVDLTASLDHGLAYPTETVSFGFSPAAQRHSVLLLSGVDELRAPVPFAPDGPPPGEAWAHLFSCLDAMAGTDVVIMDLDQHVFVPELRARRDVRFLYPRALGCSSFGPQNRP